MNLHQILFWAEYENDKAVDILANNGMIHLYKFDTSINTKKRLIREKPQTIQTYNKCFETVFDFFGFGNWKMHFCFFELFFGFVRD